MPSNMPRKTTLCSGATAYQYSSPNNPRGWEESHLLQNALMRTARLNAELEQRFSG